MALIKCEECGREISDRASACVHCGCPISKDNGKSADLGNKNEELVIKQSINEFFDKNTGRLSVAFDAVVSNKAKESTINNVYIKELGKTIELLVPNNIKKNETIWKKTDDTKCNIIVFKIKSVSIDPRAKSIAPEKKSRKEDNENKTILDIIDAYEPNAFVRFWDGPGVGRIIGLFVALSILRKLWYVETLIILLIFAIPMILTKMIYPFLHVKKYIKKNHIDDAMKNDPDYLDIAFATYDLMPCKKMLRYIKKINAEAGSEIERHLSKK